LIGHFHDYDYVLFLSDNGIGEVTGVIELYTDDGLSPNPSRITIANEWGDIAWADSQSADDNANPRDTSYGWLLFRPAAAPVPLPGTLALLGLGLLGLYPLRRR
jgi:hypothetical protein